DTVKHYKDYLPEFFPLVHPSPRNNIWQAKNPWFMEEVVPDLKNLVKDILIK
ncbi:MAG: uracil-DNA glycosylase family protein, partial [Streptococcus salivarius]